MVALARSHLKVGAKDKAALWARRAWRSRDLSRGLVQNLLKDMKSLLRAKDHLARFAHLTYRHKIRALRRHRRYLPKAHWRVVRATIALLRGRRRAARRYIRLKTALKQSVPLRYALIRYRRRKGTSSKMRAMLLDIPQHPAKSVNPKAWWFEHQAMARRALADDAPKDAYTLASAHGFNGGRYFAQAEFLAGWIALTRAGPFGDSD